MPKEIKDYTDKELENSIKVHECEIEKDGKTKVPNEELIKGTRKKEKFLERLYEERNRRIKKGRYSPDP